MKKFIVAGVQRTGTTLITTSLNSHPDIYCAGELFKLTETSWNNAVLDSGYRAYIDSSPRLKLMDMVFRRRLVFDFLDRFFRLADFDAIGFKLMFNHTRSDRFPMVVPYLIQHQVSVIHVLRENALRTYVSRLMASQRRVFHATEKVSDLPKLHVPVRNLSVKLTKIKADGEAFSSAFRGRVPYLAITYEDYISDAEAEDQRMLSFLDLPMVRLQSPLVRITPDKLSQIVANWEQVLEELHGTPFARLAT